MSHLQGKHVLMISPYGTCMHYTQAMKKELEARGAEVRLYDERPSQKAAAKIYLYFFRGVAPQYFMHYVDKIIAENEAWRPDVVYIVRGQAFDEKILKHMRDHFTTAKFIFYQWDPLCGKKIPEILKMYDFSYSFDTDDVKNNPEFKFRPSIFLKEYVEIADKKDFKYDVCFVGTIYNNRWGVIRRFQDYFKANGISSFFYLYMASWTLYLWDFIRKGTFVSPKKMQFKPMSYLENVEMVSKSKCVLDFVYSKQTGLSMRAFESMAAKRKYITNNAEVKNYPFYNPANILVVDAQNPDVPVEFIESSFEPVDEKIMYKYSIQGFINEIFENIY